jgi:two-component system, OmpR family, sensor histidine kinase CpxA
MINFKNTNSGFFRLSLFWKILGWFWLSMILILTINLFVAYINSDKVRFLPVPAKVEKELVRSLDRALNSLKKYRHHATRPPKHLKSTYLLDENGKDLYSRNTPELVLRLHQQVIKTQMPLSVHLKRTAFYGGAIFDYKDKRYWAYRHQKVSFVSRQYIGGFFKDLTQTLFFTVFIVSFPLSFALAWFITRPIKSLRQAVNQLANNLDYQSPIASLADRSDEFGELAADFRDMAQSLQQTITAQKQLLSDVSHELRSPLTRLQLALGIASQKQISQVEPDLARIKLEADRINQMLTHLLTLSRLESQQIQKQIQAFNLSELVELVVEDSEFEASQSKISIQRDIAPNIHFSGERSAMLSGIENILRNAIRYSNPMGVIKVILEQRATNIELTIQDNGPGVAPEHLTKIFDAFYRPEEDRDRRSGGVGLGLSIAMRAFVLNGGKVKAENVEPHGLKVSIEFKKLS